jgi:hypothetical protein
MEGEDGVTNLRNWEQAEDKEGNPNSPIPQDLNTGRLYEPMTCVPHGLAERHHETSHVCSTKYHMFHEVPRTEQC